MIAKTLNILSFVAKKAFVAIYALFSDNNCPLFTRLGGVAERGQCRPFLSFFFISGLPLDIHIFLYIHIIEYRRVHLCFDISGKRYIGKELGVSEPGKAPPQDASDRWRKYFQTKKEKKDANDRCWRFSLTRVLHSVCLGIFLTTLAIGSAK